MAKQIIASSTDAFGSPVKPGDRVLYRTTIGGSMYLGIAASFTPTCIRVVPSFWEKNVLESSVKTVKDFPLYLAPCALTVSVENITEDPKYTEKWDKLHFPAEFLKNNP